MGISKALVADRRRWHAGDVDQSSETMSPEACEECGAPGGAVTNTRNGVVLWSRILCEGCFGAFRAELQAGGHAMARTAEA